MRPVLIRFAGALVLIAAVFTVALALHSSAHVDEIAGRMLVEANGIVNGDAGAQERYDALVDELTAAADARVAIVWAMVLSLATCAAFAVYVWWTILRPFHTLERFAADIASANYDKPVDMPRHNVFGAFSWAFDAMREGLHDARRAESEARQANKLLIATISHDIKTPVASIRACAEGLASGQATTTERRQRYLATIVRKSDEVAQLTDDLFLHAMADMEKLVIEQRSVPLRPLIAELADTMDVAVIGDIPGVSVIADENRLLEVFGNIVVNATKYAGSPPKLSFERDGGLLRCVFSDSGTTLAPEDVPFIFDKFYRGRNAAQERGSGLGLYMVRHVVERLGGRAYAERTDEGLSIVVTLKMAPPGDGVADPADSSPVSDP